MSRIDLHLHSTASDGTDSPTQIIEKASTLGLHAVALTDHDTINGLSEAEEAAHDLKIDFIRGCEISTTTGLGPMHMVGLWLPKNNFRLNHFLKIQRENRNRRNEAIITKLRNAGISIDLEEVEQYAGASVGRPHIAEMMIRKGYAEDRKEAFSVWLGANGRAYVPRSSPSPCEVASLLNSIGASPILAHPFLKQYPINWLESLIKDLKKCGLFGIEAWHSAHSEANTQTLLSLAEKYDLGVSGGSDYHGDNKPDIELGSGRGNLDIPCSVLAELKKRRQKGGLPV